MQIASSLFPADHLLALVLERYGVREWALAMSPVLGSTADAAARCVGMMEECMRSLIDMVTFTPSKPEWVSLPGGDKRLVNVVGARKELVHTLISGPKPRSKLVKSAELAMVGYGHEPLPDPVIAHLVDSVATFRPPQGMEAGVYVLKDELYSDFDAFFHHLTMKEMLECRERWQDKRSATADAAVKSSNADTPEFFKAARPFCPPPPAPMPAFCGVRRLLWSQASARIVRGVLRDAVGAVQLRTSVSLLTAALHWLTLAVHAWPAGSPSQRYSALTGAPAIPMPPVTCDRCVMWLVRVLVVDGGAIACSRGS